ncbi:uncharacterized protein VTP21DRAFT_7490 [Calcarisporiella thermophila]|uniref:uncharacterized protein n=1 Tax=Calcarisporiella thermophila TaxID=911321 RepID=UPI0037430E80
MLFVQYRTGTCLVSKLVLLCITLFILKGVEGGVIRQNQEKTQTVPTVCDTPQCKYAAQLFKAAMDPSVNPCEDFHKFSCGGFISSINLTDEKPLARILDENQNRTKNFINDLITGKFNPSNPVKGWENVNIDKNDEDILAKVRGLYNACINGKSDHQGDHPLAVLFQKIADAAGTEINSTALGTLLGQLGTYGINPFFQTTMSAYLPDPINMLKLELPDFLVKDPLKDGDEREQITAIVQKIQSFFPGVIKLESSVAVENILEVRNLYKSLIKQIPPSSNELEFYSTPTISELSSLFPAVNWEVYLKELIPTGTSLPEKIIVYYPNIYRNISSMLVNMSYSKFQVFTAFEIAVKFLDVLFTQDNSTSIEQQCIDFADNLMLHATGRYYVLFNSDNATRTQVLASMKQIQYTFLDRLSKITWLDEVTRKNAIEKVNKMHETAIVSQVDPETLSSQSILELYAPLNVTEDHIINKLNALIFLTQLSFSSLGKRVNPLSWKDLSESDMTLHDYNAFYSDNANMMAVFAPILQHPSFDPAYPDYIKYGGPYGVLGHELIHGFDSKGKNFDGDGRYHNWWSNETSKIYNERASCFVNQYNEYTLATIGENVTRVDGSQTLSENIADNGGLAQAYSAWVKISQAGQADNRLLPGLENFTPEQMFFVAFANMWCEAATQENRLASYATDEHAPNDVRIRGVTRNSIEFAQAFNCPVPENRCEIW